MQRCSNPSVELLPRALIRRFKKPVPRLFAATGACFMRFRRLELVWTSSVLGYSCYLRAFALLSNGIQNMKTYTRSSRLCSPPAVRDGAGQLPAFLCAFCTILIAGKKILKTALTPSMPIPNVFLIAGDFRVFRSSGNAMQNSNRYSPPIRNGRK